MVCLDRLVDRMYDGDVHSTTTHESHVAVEELLLYALDDRWSHSRAKHKNRVFNEKHIFGRGPKKHKKVHLFERTALSFGKNCPGARFSPKHPPQPE